MYYKSEGSFIVKNYQRDLFVAQIKYDKKYN